METVMEKKELLLFGAGGHASKLIQIIQEQKRFEIIGYISTESKGTIITNYPVLGGIEDYKNNPALQNKYYFIAIGENSIRHEIHESVSTIHQHQERLVTLFSIHSVIQPDVRVGPGTVVMHNAVVLNQVNIGMCCIIDTGAVVEHEVTIGDFVNISPGVIICGGVNIGDGVSIGAGAIIIEKVKIGKNTLVGAGCVVVNDLQNNLLVVGNPARVVRKRKFTDKYLR